MNNHSIGIDFGTTKTLVSHINPQTGNAETLRLGRGCDYLPSSVYIQADGRMLFGDDADDMVEDETGVYLRGFKMKLGSSTPLHMYMGGSGLRTLTAKDLVYEYLRYVKRQVEEHAFLGERVMSAVITRPVNFTPAQTEELKQAAYDAGFANVVFAAEPEAAGLAFCRLQSAHAFKGNALVVDWGGGTLDLALVSRDGDTVSTHRSYIDGDTTMGGEVFDERLWQYVDETAKQKGVTLNPVAMLPKVRLGKEQLSARDSINLRLSHPQGVTTLPLERREFNQLIEKSVHKAVVKVKTLLSKIPREFAPEMLLLVGGSSQIPLIKEALEDACKLPAKYWVNSREAVAMGAALWINNFIPEATGNNEDAVKLVSEGDNYYYGNCGCVVDYEKALTYYRGAADCQYHWGYFNVGKCYHEGNGVAKNKERAKEWYRKAANMGNFWASMKLAELGVADQMNHVGDCYYHGTAERQGDEDFRAEAYRWYMNAAEQGYEWGYFNVGKCYREGIGVEENIENAKEWYRKAANMGNFWASMKLAELGVADQMNHVGDCYYHGTAERQGDEDFRAEAYRWYMKAAEQGYEWGYFNVGKCYREGIGVEENIENAKEWYRKAANMGNFWASLKLAELGVADQMNHVGDCYYHGTAERQGDEDFRAEAYRWYMKAAEQGYEWGYFNVGKCYHEGNGVARNNEKAKEWYRKAANMGNFWASMKLAELGERIIK